VITLGIPNIFHPSPNEARLFSSINPFPKQNLSLKTKKCGTFVYFFFSIKLFLPIPLNPSRLDLDVFLSCAEFLQFERKPAVSLTTLMVNYRFSETFLTNSVNNISSH
jgi:hypothetical protein